MITLARKNATRMNATNVSFIHSRINQLPLEANSIDCIISNCVLNLVPLAEKASVFTEMARVLKPGGRLAVSDFLAYKPLPQEIKDDPALLVGCVAGAVTVPEIQSFLNEAGFEDTLLVDTHKDLGIYKDGELSVSVTPCCSSGDTACGPMQPRPAGRKPLNYDLNEWIGEAPPLFPFPRQREEKPLSRKPFKVQANQGTRLYLRKKARSKSSRLNLPTAAAAAPAPGLIVRRLNKAKRLLPKSHRCKPRLQISRLRRRAVAGGNDIPNS